MKRGVYGDVSCLCHTQFIQVKHDPVQLAYKLLSDQVLQRLSRVVIDLI